ncbi:MAG: translocation/assembly module TamB domain-containing protein [Deltaproteobacteria bacterium]
MRSKILKTVGISMAALAMLIGAVLLLSRTEYFKAELKTLVQRAVSEAAGQEFTIEKIEGDLARGFRLKGVSLKIERGDFVSIEEASIRYSIASLFDTNTLFARTLVIGKIAVSGLSVNLEKGGDGAWNFDKLGGGDEKRDNPQQNSSWSVVLQSVEFDRARIRLADGTKDGAKEIDIAALDFSVKALGLSRKIILGIQNADVSVLPGDARITGVSGGLIYERDRAEIQNLRLNFNGADVQIEGGARDLAKPEFSAAASIKGFKFSRGVINIEAEARGVVRSPQDIEAQGRLRLAGSEIMGEKVSASIEKITMDGARVDIAEGTLKSGIGGLTLSGWADLTRILTKKGENSFQMNIAAQDADLSKIPGLKAKTNLLVTKADLDVEGAWREFGDFTAAVKINELAGRAKEGEFAASGTVEATSREAGFNLALKLAKLDPDTFLGDGRAKGSINSAIELDGSVEFAGDLLDMLRASVRAEIFPSTLAGIEIASAKLDASYARRELAIKSLSLASDAATISAKGDGRRMNFGYEAEVKDLAAVSKFLPEVGLGGSLSAKGRVRGSIEKAEFTLEGLVKNLASYGRDLEASAVALKADGTVGKSGELDLRSSGEIKEARIQDTEIEMGKFDAALRGDTIRAKVRVTQSDARALSAEFTLSNLRGKEKSVEVARLELSLGKTTLKSAEPISARISPEKLHLASFNIGYKESFIKADADVNFGGRARARVELSRLDLADLSSALGFEKPVSGRASGNFSLDGDFAKPRIGALLQAEGVAIGDFKSDKAGLSLNYADSSLTLAGGIEREGGEILRAGGTAEVDLNLTKLGENIPRARFNLTVKSNGIDLSPVAKLSEEIRELRGIAVIDLRVSGSVDSPKASGRVELKSAAVRIHTLRNEIKIPSAVIEIQGQRGAIRTLEVQSGGGRAKFSGDFNLGTLNYSIAGTLDNFEVKPKRITASITGDMNLSGQDGRMNITGSALVNRARIRIPEEAAKDIEDIKFTDEGGAGEEEEFLIGDTKETDFFKDKVGMDIKISLRGNTWVRGRGANVELTGNLGVAKRHENPIVITGNINAARGTYEFLGKLFEIEEGRVTFQGTPEINPFLNVRALYEVSDVDIFVNVGGTVEKPEIKLTSEPAMEETDIFSYLIFGTSSSRLGAGERVSLQQKAAETLGNLAIGELKGIVGDRLSLDLIRVQSAEGGTEFEVGKYLTDDLFIAYERDSDTKTTGSASGGGAGAVRVEYRLFDFLSLESQVGGDRAGGDVFFKFDYSCSFLEGRR